MFEEARKKAEEIINNPTEPSENSENTENEEQMLQEQGQIPPEQSEQQLTPEQITEKAVETAQNAVNVAQQKSADYEAVKDENAHLKALLNETRVSNQETVEELTNSVPVLNLSDIAFIDEEEVAKRSTEYTRQVMDYAQRNAEANILKKIEPIISKAQQAAELQEQAEVLNVLNTIPELSGISNMGNELSKIINSTRALQNPELSTEEKYITAYTILQGANGVNNRSKQPTFEEFVEMYDKTPELQNLIEQKRADKLKESQQVPNLSPSNGAGGVALNIPNKPKTFDDVKKLLKGML